MFAMLHGPWPRGLDEDATDAEAERRVGEIVGLQVDAGLDLVTDGQVRRPDPADALLRALATDDTGDSGYLVRTWRAAAALSDHVTAQAIPGPYSLARRVREDLIASARSDFSLEMAERLGAELDALVAAGCPMVLIEEPDITMVGSYPAASTNVYEAELFAATQARLLAGSPSLHAMLVIAGGSAWEAGASNVLDAKYQSYLFDLVAGPDNWYLVRAVPGDRGVVCGALRPESPADQAPELVWAARYAASSNGRGLERVGIANAGPMLHLDAAAVRRAADALVRAARLAPLPLEEAIEAGLDPRTIRQPFDPPRP
jgi:methionine synthase II (cobalamin-independent)